MFLRNNGGLQMILHFTRDSVCMGDDCFDNSRDYDLPEQAKWSDIIPLIKKENFLASVAGNNVVWVLTNSVNEEVLSFFTFKDLVIKATMKDTIKEICKGDNTLHFIYYSSPQKRGKFIFDLYKGNKYEMWHDGWLDEYEHCQVSAELEKTWKDQK